MVPAAPHRSRIAPPGEAAPCSPAAYSKQHLAAETGPTAGKGFGGLGIGHVSIGARPYLLKQPAWVRRAQATRRAYGQLAGGGLSCTAHHVVHRRAGGHLRIGGSPGDIVIPWTAGRQCFSEGHLQGGRPAGSFGPAADFTKGRGTEDATWWAGLLAARAAQPPAAGAWRTSRAIPSATCVLEPPGGRPFTRPRSSGPGTSARTRNP